MDNFLIRIIEPNENESYLNFKRSILKKDEINFRISAEDIGDASFPTSANQNSFTLGAFLVNQLVGIVSFQLEEENRKKLTHRAILGGMMIDEEFRGKGVGKSLVAEVLKRVEKLEWVEQINLTVMSHNNIAIALYSKFGFKRFSHEVDAVKWNNKYRSVDRMKLKL